MKCVQIRPTQILGKIRSPVNFVFKLRGSRKWCHALLTHPPGTVIQKLEEVGWLPFVSRSELRYAQGPRGSRKWVIQVRMRVADGKDDSLVKGRRKQTLQFYTHTHTHAQGQCCQSFRFFLREAGNVGFFFFLRHELCWLMKNYLLVSFVLRAPCLWLLFLWQGKSSLLLGMSWVRKPVLFSNMLSE